MLNFLFVFKTIDKQHFIWKNREQLDFLLNFNIWEQTYFKFMNPLLILCEKY